MIKRILISILLLSILINLSGGAYWDVGRIIRGQDMVPDSGASWFGNNATLHFGDGKNYSIEYDPITDRTYANGCPITFSSPITGTISGVLVGNIIDTEYGLKNSTAGKAQVNISSSSGLAFGTGAEEGALKIKPGVLVHVLADGTAAATNVTIADMVVGDELISVTALTNKASIATMVDRTAEYAVGAGKLTKSAGTNEAGNLLDIWYWNRT